MSTEPDRYAVARAHLAAADPALRPLVERVGPCTLRPEPDRFAVLARSIVGQMISGAAARTVNARLAAALEAHGGLTPAGVLAAPVETLRGAGLSGTKAAAVRDLAERAASGVLPLADFDALSDDVITAHLTAVRGVGPWTAEMFLIFSLGRLDVLPLADLGLRAGVKDLDGLADLPDRATLRRRAEPWRPYRSVATWYLWRGRGPVPQSA
jgi:DNA-3-methyladenine glycosylase II